MKLAMTVLPAFLALGSVAASQEVPKVPDLTVNCPNGRVVDLFSMAGDSCELLHDASGTVIGGECRPDVETAEASTAADCAQGCSVSIHPADCKEH